MQMTWRLRPIWLIFSPTAWAVSPPTLASTSSKTNTGTSSTYAVLAPPYPLGRVYRDLLGRVNQYLAGLADEVILVVAGIPVDLKRLQAKLGLEDQNLEE